MATAKWSLVQILAGMILLKSPLHARIIFPKVPSIFHPPVPSVSKVNSLTLELLQESSQDPEVRPGLFEGDMAIDDKTYENWRVGLNWEAFPNKLWKNATVPYHISALYDPSDHSTVYQAIRLLGFMTCVKFVPWNGKAKDFLLIWPMKYPAGCWSFVGKIGGPQILSLQPPDGNGPNCLGTEGRAMHELMHALGIFHEQSRPDRDQFVTINFDNIIPAFRGNFIKQAKENTTVGFEYDYDSIMHYGRSYFAKTKGAPTITPTMKNAKIGQRSNLSKTDCLKINHLYGCLSDDKTAKKYYALCRNLGI